MKTTEEIMEILAAYDLTHSFRDAAVLVGCDHHTIARYVRARDAGQLCPTGAQHRDQLIDPFRAYIEGWVEASHGRVRADVVQTKLEALDLGYAGSERTTRRAVAEAKAAYRAGHRRRFRPWLPEPGLWFQWDYADGPLVEGRKTWLWCAWLAWSRFRVVLPVRDKTLPTVIACLDATLRRFGGYVGDRCQEASSFSWASRARSPSKMRWRPTWPLAAASSRCLIRIGVNSGVVTK